MGEYFERKWAYYRRSTEHMPTAGLVFWAPLDAWSTQTASGHTLTYNGTADTAITPTEATYKGIKCCCFPGNCYWRATTSVKTVNNPYKGTISGWVASNITPSGSGSNGIVCVRANNTTEYRYGVERKSGKNFLSAGMHDNSSTYYTQDNITPATSWHHIAVTFDVSSGSGNVNQTCGVYVDGVFKNTYTATIYSYALTRLCMGNHRSDSSNSFYIAGVRLYNRILTADEITALAGEYKPTT